MADENKGFFNRIRRFFVALFRRIFKSHKVGSESEHLSSDLGNQASYQATTTTSTSIPRDIGSDEEHLSNPLENQTFYETTKSILRKPQPPKKVSLFRRFISYVSRLFIRNEPKTKITFQDPLIADTYSIPAFSFEEVDSKDALVKQAQYNLKQLELEKETLLDLYENIKEKVDSDGCSNRTDLEKLSIALNNVNISLANAEIDSKFIFDMARAIASGDRVFYDKTDRDYYDLLAYSAKSNIKNHALFGEYRDTWKNLENIITKFSKKHPNTEVTDILLKLKLSTCKWLVLGSEKLFAESKSDFDGQVENVQMVAPFGSTVVPQSPQMDSSGPQQSNFSTSHNPTPTPLLSINRPR